MTNEECLPSSDPSEYSIQANSGPDNQVERLYFHPIAEDDLGTVDNHGKVDVVLMRLAEPVASPLTVVDESNGHDDVPVVQESPDDGRPPIK